MYKLLAVIFLGAIAIVLSNKCHVSDDANQFHCGDAQNMTCKDINQIPYCHRTSRDPNEQMNGVCTCEKICFEDSECKSGCGTSGRYVGRCRNGFHSSVEQICVCVRNH